MDSSLTPIDAIYELKDTRSPFKKSMVYLVAGSILFATGFLFSGVLHWALWGTGILALLIFLVNLFSSSGHEVVLGEDRLIVKNKATQRVVMLSEIEKAELTVMQDGQLRQVPFFGDDSLQADKKSILSVTDSSGKRVEIRATDFSLSDFQSFLDVFQVNGKGGPLVEEQKIKDLISQNENYLRQDKGLKRDFEKTLFEAYKALYHVRGDYYLKQHPQANVIYKYSPNPNEPSYFIDNDYLPDLDTEQIETGKTLLAATAKNLQVIDLRIEAYQQISEKLNKMKAEQDARIKMQRVAGRLDTLQNRNTTAQLNSHLEEHQLQVETLNQLQLLTQEVNGLQDLDRAILLREQANILNS